MMNATSIVTVVALVVLSGAVVAVTAERLYPWRRLRRRRIVVNLEEGDAFDGVLLSQYAAPSWCWRTPPITTRQRGAGWRWTVTW